MNTRPSEHRRNWLLTIVSLFPLALFTYLAVGVWFIEDDGLATLYPKAIISMISLYGAFVFARLIWRGKRKKPLSDILSDIIASK